MTTLTEQLRRDRTLWTGVVLVIAGLLLGFGGAFAIGGIDVAPFPIVWEAVVRYVPGDMHTLGSALLLLAFGLLFGITPHNGAQDGRVDPLLAVRDVGIHRRHRRRDHRVRMADRVWAWGMTLLFAAIAVLAVLCWRVPPGDGPRRVA